MFKTLVLNKKSLKLLPADSGVYLFLGGGGKILYIGRAASLKKRVLNYFQGNPELRIKEMIKLAQKIRYYKTDNLLEAIILEANLIKRHLPKYNIKEKDSRSFVYVVIPKIEFASPIIVRGNELKRFNLVKTEVFGPYKSLTIIEAALRIIRRIFPYSVCLLKKKKADEALGISAFKRESERLRPCLDYQIGLCPGACIGIISQKDYQKNINNIILLLKGKKKILLRHLEKENPLKAQALRHLQDVALISKEDYYISPILNRIEGYDISHFAGKETYGAMAVFQNNKAVYHQYRLFKIKEAPAADDLRALEEMILRRLKHPEWRYPDLIVIDGGKPQIDFIAAVFKKHNIKIPFLGISKYQKDKLVFQKNTKQSFKDLAIATNEILLKVREEAHRFAAKSSQKKRIKILKSR